MKSQHQSAVSCIVCRQREENLLLCILVVEQLTVSNILVFTVYVTSKYNIMLVFIY